MKTARAAPDEVSTLEAKNERPTTYEGFSRSDNLIRRTFAGRRPGRERPRTGPTNAQAAVVGPRPDAVLATVQLFTVRAS